MKLEKCMLVALLVAQFVTVISSSVRQGFVEKPAASTLERQRSIPLLRKRRNDDHSQKDEDEMMFLLDEEVSRILQYNSLSMNFPSAIPSMVSTLCQPSSFVPNRPDAHTPLILHVILF